MPIRCRCTGACKSAPQNHHLDQLGRVPHHVLDIREPDADFSASCFREEAARAICHIRERGRKPIVVGGRGFTSRPCSRVWSIHPAVRRAFVWNSRNLPEPVVVQCSWSGWRR